MIGFREAAPRMIHPEAGAFPTGDPVSDRAVCGVPASGLPLKGGAENAIHPRLREMAEAFAECASNGPGADFQDLLARDFTVAEIGEYGAAARELAKTMIVRREDRVSALAVDRVNEACRAVRMGEFSRPPHKVMAKTVPAAGYGGTLDDMWSAFCFTHAACRIDPWPGQLTRAQQRLRAYLDRTAISDAAAKRICAALSEEQRVMCR